MLWPSFKRNSTREISRRNTRHVSGAVLLPTIRATNELAGSYRVTGRSTVLDTAVAQLANRNQEYGENCGPASIADVEEGMYQSLSHPTIIEGWWAMDGIKQTGAPAGDSFVGFELGSIGTDTPFAAAPAGGGCIQVRFHRPSNQIRLYTCKGDGATASASLTVPLTAGLTGNYNAGMRILLEYVPGQYARLTVPDFTDLVARTVTQDDPTKLPPSTWANTVGFAWCLFTGSGVCGHQFSASNFQIHTLREGFGF